MIKFEEVGDNNYPGLPKNNQNPVRILLIFETTDAIELLRPLRHRQISIKMA